MKQCKECKKFKNLDSFYRFPRNRDGHRNICKKCWPKTVLSGKQKPEQASKSQRKSRLKRKYGITLEQYAAEVAKSGGKCAICKNISELVIDHSHATGKFRGLLCGPCNRGIGLLKDDPSVCVNAAKYLENK